MANQKTSVRLVIHTDVIDDFFFSEQGPIGRLTRRAADAVLDAASRHVGTGYSGSWNNNRGGKSLSKSGRVIQAGNGNFQVVFTHRAAQVHHTGARGHMYNPKVSINSKGHPYSNVWRHKGGGGSATPYPQSASAPFHHPGHKANPYLTTAAREVGLRVSQTPGGESGSRPGFGRIPRGFV